MTDCDAVYRERDQLVAFLSKLFPAHLAFASDSEPGWTCVVCVHTPSGQMAWHVADREIPELFTHLFVYPNDWDKHTTEEKYERLREQGDYYLEARTK
jgi:hypothetical protein